MKRLLSLLLCLLLCLTLLPAAHAEAAVVLTAVAEEGDIVLTLSVTEDLNEVCGLHIRFTVPEGFAYDKARPARFHEGFAKTVNTEQLDFILDSAQSRRPMTGTSAICRSKGRPSAPTTSSPFRPRFSSCSRSPFSRPRARR